MDVGNVTLLYSYITREVYGMDALASVFFFSFSFLNIRIQSDLSCSLLRPPAKTSFVRICHARLTLRWIQFFQDPVTCQTDQMPCEKQ